MKLVRFIATNVHGYMNFDIDFNHDVSFLVGSNGSGKTTAIKLIKAILTPSVIGLTSVSFSQCLLSFERNGKLNVIDIKKSKGSNDKNISISYNEISDNIKIPEYLTLDDDVNDYEIDKSFNSKVFDRIKKLPTPIFLGVDRKNKSNSSAIHYYKESFVNSRRKHSAKGLLGDALMETQLMIQDSYRYIRNLEEKQSGALRDSILKSSFKFTSFNPEEFITGESMWKKSSQLISKKNEILRGLSKIGQVDDSLKLEVDNFFSSLQNLFHELENAGDEQGLSLNWLMNQAQIRRISDLVDVIDSYDNKVQDIYKPVNQFLDTVNLFFKDSNKQIVIDPVGRINVKITGIKALYSVDCLSSGERQLLIIIANVLFNKYSSGGVISKRSIIIIDEPELSLHMRWQETFSEIVLEVSPETQFILATHSPDIVGDLGDKCKYVSKLVGKHA